MSKISVQNMCITKYPDVIYVAENGALIRKQEKIYSLHQYFYDGGNDLEMLKEVLTSSLIMRTSFRLQPLF